MIDLSSNLKPLLSLLRRVRREYVGKREKESEGVREREREVGHI